ncbi:MAG: DUF58 domain-containing protein [Spirochaetaceae bacterium]|jgi:uncharacterized protein (DUF58 family)|nr:DUF58 domain-containing protein [Spirochaetaceae bacterium]
MNMPFPKPRYIGIFSLCIAVFSFTAGFLRKEPVLPLIGAVFIACLAYCFLSVFFLALIHRKKAAVLSVKIIPEKINIHENVTAFLSQKIIFFQMPGILIRYKLLLATKDNKKIEYIFKGNFFKKTSADFPAERRGAYYGIYDNLIFQDIFGFFYSVLKLPHDSGERLLVMPSPAEFVPAARYLASGTARRSETEIRRTDDLTEQRPYIPGDDPRRINWKLYSHAGELFVRQEEREPPPHSQFILLIDTYADSNLYSADKGVAAVDALCSIALSLLIEKTASGTEVLFSYTGGVIKSGISAELLSYPACTMPDCGQKLPAISAFPGACSILIMALARTNLKEDTNLHEFIKGRGGSQVIQVMFFYNSEKLKSYAEASAIIFNRISGVQAFAAGFTEKSGKI